MPTKVRLGTLNCRYYGFECNYELEGDINKIMMNLKITQSRNIVQTARKSFCSCPYCGQVGVCDCNLEISENDKTMMTKVYSNLLMEKRSSVTDKDDVWWRLEKWQIGRKNFP